MPIDFEGPCGKHTQLFRDAAELALRQLPQAMRERLDEMSPAIHVDDIKAALILVGHDRDDLVIPVGESRRLASFC